jgi:hypothetical protein
MPIKGLTHMDTDEPSVREVDQGRMCSAFASLDLSLHCNLDFSTLNCASNSALRALWFD